jgi:hypothetical protein
MRYLILTAMLLTGCGEAPPTIVANVVMQGIMKDEVESLGLYAFGPMRSDGIFLTCTTLLGQQPISPDDKRIETLAHAEVSFDDATRTVGLSNVASGEGRLIYVEARDAAGGLVGNGCTEPVTIGEGATVPVEVTVLRI